jgi:hypothetical protein
MSRRSTLKRTLAGAVLSGSLGLVGIGLAAGSAQADMTYTFGPFQWCPGQSMPNDSGLAWDMSICHTYYYEQTYGMQGGVGGPRYWEGENIFPNPIPPPPPQPLPADCPPWSPFLAPSRCGGL